MPGATSPSCARATAWVRRFALAGRPGPYFRVLEEGVVAAGDPIDVLATGAQKFLLGCPGIAFVYVRPEVAARLRDCGAA